MSTERKEKRKQRKKRRKLLRLIINILVLAIIIYLVMLGISMFGKGGFQSGLRDYDAINEPAEYLEEVLNIKDTDETGENASSTVEIVVREDKIFSGEDEIQVSQLEQIIIDSRMEKVTLVDDGAKRVTYAKVYDEIEKLGVIIEEK